MQFLGCPSSDGHGWGAAAGGHGRGVYRSDGGDVDVRGRRLVRLRHLAQRGCRNGACSQLVDSLLAVSLVLVTLVRLGDMRGVRWF